LCTRSGRSLCTLRGPGFHFVPFQNEPPCCGILRVTPEKHCPSMRNHGNQPPLSPGDDLASDFGFDVNQSSTVELRSATAARPRAILSSGKVVAIFRKSLPSGGSDSFPLRTVPRASAAAVGREYGVSEKTVRDIWSGRTW
jgi:hypothetical protein